MLSRSTTRRPAARSGTAEEGQALIFAIIGVALLASIPLMIVTTTVGQLPLTTSHLEWNAAYEAGQAGLNDYLQHLDADGSYARYTTANPDPSNPAFTGWVAVPSTDPAESYEYSPSILEGQYAGLIGLTVSGKAVSGGTTSTRTFKFRIRPASSLNTIYWTNYETLDGTLADPAHATDDCKVYQGQGALPSGCIVQFYPGDVLDGPVFSNDGFYICDNAGSATPPTFESSVSSGDSYSATRWQEQCPGTNTSPVWPAGSPIHAANTPPQTTDASDLTAAEDYGCYISGSPTFTLDPNAADPTKLTWTGGTLDNASNNPNSAAACGGASGGGTVSIATGALKANIFYASGNITVSGEVQGALTLVSGADIIIDGPITYPSADKVEPSGGDWSDASDVVGLIAQTSVEVLHAGNGTQCSWTLGSTTHPTNCDYKSGIEIDAAILALNQSFYVQNYYLPNCGGADGTLTVFGSIAQFHRGPVGTSGSCGSTTFTTGYLKSYHYDSTLQTIWPPYFLPPQGAVWSAVSYTELPPGASSEAIPGT